jgi:hypothetical protein
MTILPPDQLHPGCILFAVKLVKLLEKESFILEFNVFNSKSTMILWPTYNSPGRKRMTR